MWVLHSMHVLQPSLIIPVQLVSNCTHGSPPLAAESQTHWQDKQFCLWADQVRRLCWLKRLPQLDTSINLLYWVELRSPAQRPADWWRYRVFLFMFRVQILWGTDLPTWEDYCCVYSFASKSYTLLLSLSREIICSFFLRPEGLLNWACGTNSSPELGGSVWSQTN